MRPARAWRNACLARTVSRRSRSAPLAEPIPPRIARDDVNRPEIVAELTAMYDRYERALMADDRTELGLLFWDDPTTIHYAVASSQNGYAAVKADRDATTRSGGAVPREIRRITVTTYRACYGTVNVEYFRPSSARHGRQSQVWVKGWRVVSAHVSLVPVPPAAAG
jgi:hypothetical protein